MNAAYAGTKQQIGRAETVKRLGYRYATAERYNDNPREENAIIAEAERLGISRETLRSAADKARTDMPG